MSSTALAVAGLIAGAGATLVGSLTVYVVQARKISGKIATSEAAQLWEESRAIREEYHARIKELNGVIARCEDRVVTLERREGELTVENQRLRNELAECRAKLDNWGPH